MKWRTSRSRRWRTVQRCDIVIADPDLNVRATVVAGTGLPSLAPSVHARPSIMITNCEIVARTQTKPDPCDFLHDRLFPAELDPSSISYKRAVLSKDGMERAELYSALDEKQLDAIHHSTLRVLERTGLVVYDDNALS